MNGNAYVIPLAIVVAGGLIAGAIWFAPKGTTPNDVEGVLGKGVEQAAQVLKGGNTVRPVDANDHINGNPAAPVKIIEYSDLECPFCKRFHVTMQQAMEEYGKSGKVAWVYRHFPLDALHSKARKEAEATECATKLGGNNAFWAYVDRLFVVTPSNNGLDLNELSAIAAFIGLDRSTFQTCLDSGEFADHVANDLKDAQAAGGSGTPYSIAIAANGEKFPINGAQPYEEVKRVIEAALQAK